jgi:hypothetical protein
MEKEWKELVAIFQKNVELHKHLQRFQEIPQQFIDDVKKLYSFWKFQTRFIEKELPENALEQLNQMKTIIMQIHVDYALAKVI